MKKLLPIVFAMSMLSSMFCYAEDLRESHDCLLLKGAVAGASPLKILSDDSSSHYYYLSWTSIDSSIKAGRDDNDKAERIVMATVYGKAVSDIIEHNLKILLRNDIKNENIKLAINEVLHDLGITNAKDAHSNEFWAEKYKTNMSIYNDVYRKLSKIRDFACGIKIK